MQSADLDEGVQKRVGLNQILTHGGPLCGAGLGGLTRDLAQQWTGRKGIRVNALAPGYFASEMTADLFTDERLHAWATRQTPMRRTGREGELDGALLYLASDASSFVTGSVLAVDGGWTAV